ncbi:MAG: biotin transporter BioY [Candidatus Omnitrophica bacterium]|nr:biotin transporter BioY [Candidatus Omnitrophota bacterium]
MESILKKEIITNKIICKTLGVLFFVILTALGAFVRIPLPFTPVPVTLQTLFVLLSGAFLGSSLGFTSQISYLFLGVLGFPVFTLAGSSLLYFLGPTGGYILGFILASYMVGRLLKKPGNITKTLMVFSFCSICILLCGSLWIKYLLGVSFAKALYLGFAPFIIGDLCKACIAALIYSGLKGRVGA